MGMPGRPQLFPDFVLGRQEANIGYRWVSPSLALALVATSGCICFADLQEWQQQQQQW